MDYDELLNTSTDVAFALLESGAEIYRVEEAIHRIFRAYGVEQGAVFAIPTLLILSVQDDKGHPLTEIRRLGNHGSDLAKVDAYNNLCRQICQERPSFEAIRRELARRVNLRNTPEIRFIVDQSIEYGVNISRKIDEVTRGLNSDSEN